ncbi:MAG: hypothetical protein ABSH35_01320 [Isosphaeraceae bacterium]|jgi:hypothetical protein
MATPNDSSGTDQDEIQFEQAEFPAETSAIQEHVTRCNACAAAIPDVYFEAGGKIVCAPCRDKIEAMFHQGQRFGRGFKAIVFGTIAAALGATLYYAIMRITGLNICLVAVVVGLMVGGAVKAGSGNCGGRFYQLLAVFLTYSAIAAMYIPDMLEALRKGPDQEAPAQVAVANGKPAPAPAPAPLKQAKLEAGKKDHAPAAQPAVQPPRAQREWPGLGVVLLALGVLIGLAYSLPVLIAFQAPISGLIFGFALWEAWKLNRRVQLAFNGPFRLGTLHGDEPAIQPEEADDEP